jgi:anhydro-N-acetylmuramic acid kinase
MPSLFQKHTPLCIVGLMSGTSLDGIDACAVHCQDTPQGLKWTVLGTHSGQYSPAMRQQLLAMQQPNATVTLAHLTQLHRDVALSHGQVAHDLIQQLQRHGHSVHAVASHGQTVYHQPPQPNQAELAKSGCTLQLGEAAYLAEMTGLPVVSNFRPRDMAAGGQGAPLVPFAEQHLFAPLLKQGKRLLIQNIGGIANATVLSHLAIPMAFDTGPGNMLMDGACLHLTGKPYDHNGQLAAAGTVDKSILTHLMNDPYLRQPPPKSTGRELYGQGYLQALFNRFTHRKAEDWLATLTAFTAHSIANAYQQWVIPKTSVDLMIVGGGGAHNPVLMGHLQQLMAPIPVQTHADWHIPNQYKEAMAFALLGWATLTGQTNNMPSCTGARHPVIMGSLTLA